MQYDNKVNVTALDRAVEILFGAEMVATFHRVYHVLDRTMNETAAQAFEVGKKTGYDDGYLTGYHEGYDDGQYDDITVEEFESRLGDDEIAFSLQHDSGDEMPDLSGCAGFFDDRHNG